MSSGAVHHWWMQRVTAAVLVPVSLYLIYRAVSFLPDVEHFDSLILIIADPMVAVSMILAAAIGCYHACLGVEEIIEDYVHDEQKKKTCLLLNKFFFIVAGVIASALVVYIANVLYKGMPE